MAVTLPTNIGVGDLLSIAIGETLDNGFTTPAGWISVNAAADGFGGDRVAYFRRIANGSEGASVTITTGGTATMTAVAWRTTGFDSTTPINVSATGSGTSGSATAMTATTATTTVANCDVIRVATTRNSTSISQPAANTNIGADSSGTAFDQAAISVCFKSQAGAGASGTAAFVSSGTDRGWACLTVAIAPGASATAPQGWETIPDNRNPANSRIQMVCY